MIKKEELLKFLKEAEVLEEKSIPVYTKHLDSTLFLSGFSKEEQEELKKVLLILKKGSEEHREIYEDLINKIRESAKDVY
ncbi:MAG: hypothetical protein PHP73_00285 [Candidatus Omnitrophica bacterium]|nr:hypothetical protein [Candidatus Omnitrophota bacterium]